MTRWEYARLESTDQGVGVVFTHREAWPKQGPEAFFATLRQLGDEGWELVSALPLGAAVRHPQQPDQLQLRVEPDRWLLFKRPLPDPPASQEKKGEDVLKDIVGRQLLKGRLPLP
jgi:hypothetical protein